MKTMKHETYKNSSRHGELKVVKGSCKVYKIKAQRPAAMVHVDHGTRLKGYWKLQRFFDEIQAASLASIKPQALPQSGATDGNKERKK